jgi:hypothetical protein
MHITKIIIAVMLSFSLAACSLSAAEPTATPTATTAPTQVTLTLAPTFTPTNTPTVTPSPTATRPSTTGGQPSGQPAACTYNLAFVADMSLPDGTQVFTGTSITKTWRVRNSGNCAWTSGFTFRQIDGDAMSATTINSPSVAVGATVDISVTLNVGTNIAAYTPLERANFRMYDNAGRAFGNTLYAELAILAPNTSCSVGAAIVSEPANGTIQKGQTLSISWTIRNTGTCTWQNYRIGWMGSNSTLLPINVPLNLQTTAPNQSVTFTVQVQLSNTATGSGTATMPLMVVTDTGVAFGPVMNYQASYNLGNPTCTNASTVTSSPANGILQMGQTQSVSWTIRNDGTCTWQSYRIERMGNDSPVLGTNLPLTLSDVAPGQSVSFTVNVQLAPQASGSGTVTLPLMLVTNTGAGVGVTMSYLATYNVTTACFYDSDFVADVNIPDDTIFRAGETITKTWRIRNSGTCAWENFTFVMIENDAALSWVGIVPYVTLPRVEAGAEVEISVMLAISPETATGTRPTARFQVQNSNGQVFGTMPYVQILIDNNIRY